MLQQHCFPSSTSELILPAASGGFSTTLKSLRRSTLSIPNRLSSIQEDSEFVQQVSEVFKLPLVANERCGSWYIPVGQKSGSVYFKSTDGHAGQWAFSLRRLNLQLLALIGGHNGCIVVDSTRRGKSMPDALSKTIPIWVAVFNRVLFPTASQFHKLQYPTVLAGSEISQIEQRLDSFVDNLLSLNLDLDSLRKSLGRPMRAQWITRDQVELIYQPSEESHDLLLCSASRRVIGAETSEGGYIQGAGDDCEGWSHGLNPEIFWKNYELLGITPEDQLPDMISDLLKASEEAQLTCEPTLVSPSRNLYIGRHTGSLPGAFEFVIACSTGSICKGVESINIDCPDGKAGSRHLRKKLPGTISFVAKNWPTIQSKRLLITCSTGRDLSIGVAVAILTTFYDERGQMSLCQDDSKIDKQLVRERLAWITSSKSDANPSRSTLQAVNSYLIDRP